jgi:hypothetical protein
VTVLVPPGVRDQYIREAPTAGSRATAPVVRRLSAAAQHVLPAHPTKGDQLLRSAGHAVPGLVALANPIAGAAYNGIDAFGAASESAKAHGASGDEASQAGIVSGVVNALLGALPAPGIRMLSAPAERLASPVLAAALRTAAAGGTNAVYGATNQLASNAVARSTYDPRRRLLEGVPQAAATAGVFGTLTHGAVEAGSAGANAVNAWRTDTTSPDAPDANQQADDQVPQPVEAKPSGRQNSVAYSMQLDPSDYGRSRRVHYNRRRLSRGLRMPHRSAAATWDRRSGRPTGGSSHRRPTAPALDRRRRRSRPSLNARRSAAPARRP